MRFLFLAPLLVAGIISASDIDDQIKRTSERIGSFSQDYSKINKEMAQNAKDILMLKKEILNQKKYLETLQAELSDKEKSYNENLTLLKELKEKQKELKKAQDDIEQRLVFTIAQSVTLSIILEEEYSTNAESLIEFEVLQDMLKLSKENAQQLNQQFFSNAKDIELLNHHAAALESAISTIDAKQKELIGTQEKNKKALAQLEKQEVAYKKELKELLGKQDELKKTLAELNIIKIDEINKAKEEEERRAAFDAQAGDDLPNVKKHGSSYQAVKTIRYKGPKTISPIDNYTITKTYGNYTDPLYSMKIFNESISLKPKEPNEKVKTVFNGRVVYADKTAVLDNIVIVEHSDGLHTIYANLSQISPDIKKGTKIKKGYTIGRVSEELIFEVTQKSYHIDPQTLFQ